VDEISRRGLEKIPRNSKESVQTSHFSIGKMEVITESRQKRRNHPKKPVNNSMGDHEDDHENPTRLVLRRRYSHMLRQENRKTGIYVFAVGAAILFNVSVVLHFFSAFLEAINVPPHPLFSPF